MNAQIIDLNTYRANRHLMLPIVERMAQELNLACEEIAPQQWLVSGPLSEVYRLASELQDELGVSVHLRRNLETSWTITLPSRQERVMDTLDAASEAWECEAVGNNARPTQTLRGLLKRMSELRSIVRDLPGTYEEMEALLEIAEIQKQLHQRG